MKNDIILKTLNLIEAQTGLKLTLCDYFTGICTHNEEDYFNVVLPKKISESMEYDTLLRFANKYNIIRVEPNGVNRLAIFFNEDKIK